MSRRFTARRTVGLSDVDATGRLRLDTIARYLQDIASDDVADAGWPPDAHVWVVRRTELEVIEPFRDDLRVDLETWASGIAAAAASRRYSLRGDRGGHVEAESVWIHLDRALRPLRLGERFLEIYGPSAEGRRTSTKLTLPPPPVTPSRDWPLRATDVDRLGHVNNAAYWEPVEELWAGRLGGRLRAILEYRKPIDLGDRVGLAAHGDLLWLLVDGEVRAAATILAA
ncbi:MAG: acyl-ACP thioesterase domain-containing protein [Gaiellaceae bacterium]